MKPRVWPVDVDDRAAVEQLALREMAEAAERHDEREADK